MGGYGGYGGMGSYGGMGYGGYGGYGMGMGKRMNGGMPYGNVQLDAHGNPVATVTQSLPKHTPATSFHCPDLWRRCANA